MGSIFDVKDKLSELKSKERVFFKVLLLNEFVENEHLVEMINESGGGYY
jgi:hypothetical protein